MQKAGYVNVTKGYVGSRPRTWVEATRQGHRAYRQHLLALRAITEGILDDSSHDTHDRGYSVPSSSQG